MQIAHSLVGERLLQRKAGKTKHGPHHGRGGSPVDRTVALSTED